MIRQEINYLVGRLSKEGKTPSEIADRISNLIISQEGFKHLKRENTQVEKRLDKASKKIDDLRDQLKRKDKKIFDLSLKRDRAKLEKTTRPNTIKTANVHQLKRIELFLEDSGEPLNQREIYTACGMIKDQCISGLNYLVHHNLIKFEKGKFSK